jgi:hypothetical protein
MDMKKTGESLMNITKQLKNKILVLPAITALLVFSGNAGASDAIIADINTKYNNPVDSSGALIECKSCHVNEVPIPPIADSTLKPNFQEAYNADKINYTGLMNLLQGCQGGGTANPTQPWVCEGGTPPAPIPTPVPTTPTACDDAANAGVCSTLSNQYGSLGSADSGAEMTDIYKVKCGKNTKALKVSVSDLTPDNPSAVSIQAFKGLAKSPSSTDTVDGDGDYSKAVKLTKGNGQYLVKIKKSNAETAGVEIYDATMMCVGGKQAQFAVKIKQNQ